MTRRRIRYRYRPSPALVCSVISGALGIAAMIVLGIIIFIWMAVQYDW